MKNKVQVSIDGKLFPLMGTETSEYITSVAEYIDKKISIIRESDKLNSLTSYLAVILACVNITDELFKEREKTEGIELFEKNDSKTIRELIPKLEEELKFTISENNKLKEELKSIENMYIEELKSEKESFEKEKKELERKIDSLQTAIVGKSADYIDLSELRMGIEMLGNKIDRIEDSFRGVIAEEKRKAVCLDKRYRAEIYSAKERRKEN